MGSWREVVEGSLGREKGAGALKPGVPQGEAAILVGWGVGPREGWMANPLGQSQTLKSHY